jgi:hypothetical protein
MTLLTIQLALILSLFFYANYKIIRDGQVEYLIVFLIFYLPFYFTLQSLLFQQTHSLVLISIFRYLKEIIILNALVVTVGAVRNPFGRSIHLTAVDKCLGLFTILAVAYAILPIGDNGLVDRVLYLKKILLPSAMYLIGRMYTPHIKLLPQLMRAALIVALLAFGFNLIELITGTHYHSRIGWAAYDFAVNEVEPTGHYGIGWNFEIGPNKPRFAAFFANTLESGVSSLLGFALIAPMFLFTRYKSNQAVYGIVILMILFSNYLAFSRASLVAIFFQVGFVAYLLRYYRLLLGVVSVFAILVSGILILGAEELRYLILDTITFRQMSSFGHLIEWIRAIESMIENPLGIGLGTSGNIGAMSDVAGEDSIGGENQYFIYGVQLGIVGMLLYVMSLFFVIFHSVRLYNRSNAFWKKNIAMSAAVVKFGFLLPLFTSNAETFQYASFMSWWIAGLSMSYYSDLSRSVSKSKETVKNDGDIEKN